jgi:HEXXH motif-containing protein
LRRDFADVTTIARLLTPDILQRHVSSEALNLLGGMDAANSRILLSDPSTVWWIDEASNLIRARERGLAASLDWAKHIADLNFIAAAASVLCRSSFAFDAHIDPRESRRIPIVGVIIANDTNRMLNATVRVDAMTHVQVDAGDLTVLAPTRIEKHEFAFRDAGPVLPALPRHKQLLRSEFDLVSWQRVLEAARKITRVRPKWDELISLFGHTLGPLQPDETYHLSVSVRSLPKLIFLAESQDPIAIAEVLVHESDHNMLYAMDRRFTFWKDGTEAHVPVHWSPWRNDLRPLDGNLRGASAFTSISEFLLDVASSPNVSGEQRDAALRRAILTANQVREALSILFDAGDNYITDAGRGFLEQLNTRLERVMEDFPSNAQMESFRDAAMAEIKSKKLRSRQPAPSSHGPQ